MWGSKSGEQAFRELLKTARFLNTTLIQNIDSGVPGRGVPDLPLNEPAVAIECGRCKLAGTCRALFIKNPRSVRGPSCYTRNITIVSSSRRGVKTRSARIAGGRRRCKNAFPMYCRRELGRCAPCSQKISAGKMDARRVRRSLKYNPACAPSGTHGHAPTRARRGEHLCASRRSIVLARKQKAFGLTEGISSRTRPEASARRSATLSGEQQQSCADEQLVICIISSGKRESCTAASILNTSATSCHGALRHASLLSRGSSRGAAGASDGRRSGEN